MIAIRVTVKQNKRHYRRGKILDNTDKPSLTPPAQQPQCQGVVGKEEELEGERNLLPARLLVCSVAGTG